MILSRPVSIEIFSAISLFIVAGIDPVHKVEHRFLSVDQQKSPFWEHRRIDF